MHSYVKVNNIKVVGERGKLNKSCYKKILTQISRYYSISSSLVLTSFYITETLTYLMKVSRTCKLTKLNSLNLLKVKFWFY
jgi:hypothetical protein